MIARDFTLHRPPEAARIAPNHPQPSIPPRPPPNPPLLPLSPSLPPPRTPPGASLDPSHEVELREAAERLNTGADKLSDFVRRAVGLVAADVFVRAVESFTSEGEAGTGMGGHATLPLTPHSVSHLVHSSLPLARIFWDDIWPQLAEAGWKAEGTEVKGEHMFYPPQEGIR